MLADWGRLNANSIKYISLENAVLRRDHALGMIADLARNPLISNLWADVQGNFIPNFGTRIIETPFLKFQILPWQVDI